MAKLTKRLKSPNALGVSLPKPGMPSGTPPSTLVALASSPGSPPGVLVGENSIDEEGEVIILSAGAGSMSRLVKNEVSDRSSLVEVTERKISKSFC